MFSSDNPSKQDLIAKLNVLTIKINNIINNLSSKELQRSLKYLLNVSSVTDPGQFNNLNTTIDDAIVELTKIRNKQRNLAGAFGLMGLISLSFLFKAVNNDSGNSDPALPSGLALFSSIMTGYKFYSIKSVDDEIAQLNKIKTMLSKAIHDNERLSKMLKAEEGDFRKEFYKEYILAYESAEQKEISDANKSKGSFVFWKPAESFLPQVGFAKVPGINVDIRK